MQEQKQLKTKSAEQLYWRVKGLCSQLIYDWADAKFHQHNVEHVVEKYVEQVNPRVNKRKAKDKLERIFAFAGYAHDLPEHPERHNGYFKSYQYEEAVMSVFGYKFTFAKQKSDNYCNVH